MHSLSPAARAGIDAEIAAYNAARAAIASSVKSRRWLALGGAVVATIVLFATGLLASNAYLLAGAFLAAIFGGIFGWIWAGQPAADAQNGARERIFPSLFPMVGDFRYFKDREPDCMAGLPGAAIGGYRSATYGDCVAGRYRDAQVELFEGRFSTKSGKSTTTVFQGVIVGFDLPREFPATLVAIARRMSLFGAIGDAFSSLKTLQTGNAALEGLYEIRTDNPQAALPLAHGKFARALGGLAAGWNDNLPRVALAGWSGYVLLPSTKDWLELPSIFTELDFGKHVEPLQGELLHLLDTALAVRESLKE